MVLIMRKKTIAEKLASHISGVDYEKLSRKIIDKVKLCVLDLFGAHFAGYRLTATNPIKDYILSGKTGEGATVWSLGTRTTFTEAAFANSALSHITVFDDMHAETASHFGSIVIPAAFAVGEHRKCSGKDIIAAIVSGYEAGIRVGTALMHRTFSSSGFRPSGTFGVFASAVAAGKLFGLNTDQLTSALGLAGNFGLGLMAFAHEGTDDLMYHNALASRNGILSAILAKNGAVAPRSIFEINGGVLKTYGANIEDGEKITENLGEKFRIEEVYFKSIPACAFVQSAAMAALEIINTDKIRVEDIEKINVRIFPHGKNYPGLDHCGPFQGVMQAQMSNPYTVASILIRKRVVFEDYVNFEDSSVHSLAQKIELVEDQEAAERFPYEQLAKVHVQMKDGTVHSAISKNPHFLDNNEVIDKCRKYLGLITGDDACEDIVKSVQSIESMEDINELTEKLILSVKH
jgi:2-methylcitrate dehydratase PrpD